MTLRDKIAQCPDKQGWTNPNYGIAENIEKIADDYAVEFHNWIMSKTWNDKLCWSLPTTELLAIFKKEKGL
jgi:hypothetical protein